jgi:hypothetical protein
MKRFYLYRLRNNRIKNICLGIVGLMLNGVIIYMATLGIIKNVVVSISFVVLGVVWLLAFIPMGQAFELTNSANLLFYYQLGPYKLWSKSFSGPPNISIEQDKDRYYILRLSGPGLSRILERCPTLAEINECNDHLKRMLTE